MNRNEKTWMIEWRKEGRNERTEEEVEAMNEKNSINRLGEMSKNIEISFKRDGLIELKKDNEKTDDKQKRMKKMEVYKK